MSKKIIKYTYFIVLSFSLMYLMYDNNILSSKLDNINKFLANDTRILKIEENVSSINNNNQSISDGFSRVNGVYSGLESKLNYQGKTLKTTIKKTDDISSYIEANDCITGIWELGNTKIVVDENTLSFSSYNSVTSLTSTVTYNYSKGVIYNFSESREYIYGYYFKLSNDIILINRIYSSISYTKIYSSIYKKSNT